MKLFKVIDEKEGKKILKGKQIIFEEEAIILSVLIKNELDIDYIQNIINFLTEYKTYSLISVVISVFNKNKEKEILILDESIKKLKNINHSLIIVLNKEKEILKAKKNLVKVVKKICNFGEKSGFNLADLRGKVSLYNFSSARGEEKCEKVVDNLFLSVPKKYIEKYENCFLRIEQPINMRVWEASEIIIDKISQKLIQKENSLEVGIEMSQNLKNRVDVDIIFNEIE